MVSDHLFQQPDNSTPLTAEEREGLKAFAFTRTQLNSAERANVLVGGVWALRSRKDWWTDEFLCELHVRMFGQVWAWAGDYRTTDKGIGDVPPYRVPMDVRQVMDDARAWAERASYEPQELAIRLHHRLVWIHPFINGNGRCTRMMADIVVKRMKSAPLTWGGATLVETGPLRKAYLAALKAADRHDIAPLLAFARS